MKVLKITDPPIKGYPDYAYPLSVLLNHDYAWEWFYCNFIQLHFDENDMYNPVRFYYADGTGNVWNTRNPLLDYEVIHMDTLALLGNDIISFLTGSINSDNYIMINLNEFYIRDRRAYSKTHYGHINFIYGYDEREEYFYAAGYDKNMQYSYSKISFAEIEQAYKNYRRDYYEDNNKIYLLKMNKTRKRYEFDITAVIRQLKEFVNGEDSQSRYYLEFNGGRNFYFGTDIYRPLMLHLEAIHEYKWDWNLVKPIYMLYEHKKLMALRLCYMEETGWLKDGKYSRYFNELAEMYSEVMHKFLKYMIIRKKTILDNIASFIEKSANEETTLLKELIKELESSKSRPVPAAAEGMSGSRHYAASDFKLDAVCSGRLEISFAVTAMAEKLNFLIGFAPEEVRVRALYDLPVQLRLNAQGYFDALNRDSYQAICQMEYIKMQNYNIRIIVDLELEKFDVYVAPGGSHELKLAEGFSFQRHTPPPKNIGKICIVHDSINNIAVNNAAVRSLNFQI